MLASIAIHVAAICLLVGGEQHVVRTEARSTSRVEPTVEMDVEMISVSSAPAGGSTSGGGAIAVAKTETHTRSSSKNAWQELSVRDEGNGNGNGNGNGSGSGNGNGSGNGIGFGNGGGVAIARDVPAPPVPEVSKARPAKLIWPTRDVEVADESYLFVAKVTVDKDGSVVGARMVTTRPGSRGDHAANAIWQFRYAPALDDRGVPVRSTFEQPFQVR